MESTETKQATKGANKLLIILGALLVIIILAGVGFYVMGGGTEDAEEDNTIEQVQIPEIQPEDIGFESSMSQDGRNILINITEPEGIDSIDLDVSYDTEGDLPRGTFATIDIASGESLPKEVFLGTCSSGTCVTDKVVGDINITAKVNYTNGDVAQLQDTVSMAE